MSENKVQVLLENKEMWKKFDRVGNEMILSRTGRRMFPSVKVRVYGLEPTMYYFVLLDIVPKDNHRYTFAGRQWLARGPADLPLTPRLYTHPDCPTSGSQLMKQSVSFHKIYLNSMHKYVARVHIVAGSDILKIPLTCFNTFSFPETTFVAVTAYQNELVVKLKVDNNPFAKNFRFKRCAKTQMDSKCEEEKSREPLGKKTKLESFETHCSNGFEPENYQSGLTKMSHLVIPMNLKLSDSTINKMKNGSFASGLQNSLTSLNTGTETAITLHSPPSSVDTRTETTRLGNCRKTSTDTLLPPSVEMTSPLMATNHYRQLLMSLPFERNDYFSLSFNPHVSQFIPFNSAVMTSYFGLKPFSIPAFSGP
ncbi:T-box-containing protein TBX6L-like isoform X2 [Tachypleus tridentatus]|uniref:T-box-containing protein TBX6L-like isoform X2 n=1 Tax=Tachypleus tridentatus TaxID=6853 RepID=UPI003FD3139C